MADAPPAIPPEFQIYNSHKIDPIYQWTFTLSWSSVAVLFVLASLPSFIWSLRMGRLRDTWLGIRKGINAYEPVDVGREGTKLPARWKVHDFISALKVSAMWTISLLGLDVGQLMLVTCYYITVAVCTTLKAELVENPNRPGFIAVAQLPPVFLFAMKNSPLSVLLSSGYEKLNFLHRWCSRAVIIAATVHGSLWMWDRYSAGLPIIGKRKDVTGVTAFSILCILGLTSVRPVRRRVFQVFRVVHLLSVPAFGIAMRYHTKLAIPYLYPALALWGIDLLLRAFRFRMRGANLIAPDTQMTIIRVHACASGWSPGQHVRLRVLFPYRMFESHALTIMNAQQTTTCLEDVGLNHELLLGARVSGDWSRALSVYAHGRNAHFKADVEETFPSAKSSKVSLVSEGMLEDSETMTLSNLSISPKSGSTTEVTEALLPRESDWSPTDQGRLVQVMLDGPYGGCSFDLGSFQSVLLISGGSGVTFTVSLLDDLIGRCLRLGRPNGEITQRVEFVWYIPSVSALRWVSPLLSAIAFRALSSESGSESTPGLHISIYITRPGGSESEEGDVSSTSIPNCDVTCGRPVIRELLDNFVASSGDLTSDDTETCNHKHTSNANLASLAICAAGPETLTSDVRDGAARLALCNPFRRIDCHTEVYSL